MRNGRPRRLKRAKKVFARRTDGSSDAVQLLRAGEKPQNQPVSPPEPLVLAQQQTG
ncbi:MAG TPA: hypothetical protein GXZ82_11045 [Firmicutes bacterium]|jgi:hypothetical protein|nr:hypothetical protein [Bacillota bacterium]